MNTQIKIEQRDPSTLKASPQLKHIPALAPDSAAFDRIKRMVWETGLTRPIPINDQGEVLTDDGRTLLAIAKLQGLETVAVAVYDGKRLPQLVLNDLFGSRTVSLGARALCAVPYLLPALEFARQWRLAGGPENAIPLRGIGGKPSNPRDFFAELAQCEALKDGLAADFGRYLKLHPPKMHQLAAVNDKPTRALVNAIADWLGIKPSLLYLAIKLRREFDNTTEKIPRAVSGGSNDGDIVPMTFEEYYLPKLMGEDDEKPMGLGAVHAGIASDREAVKNGGIPKDQGRQMELFCCTFTKEAVARWNYYSGMDEAGRKNVMSKIKDSVEQLEAEQCLAMAEFYKTLAKTCADAAKQSA